MPILRLREYTRAEAVQLTPAQRDGLLGALPSLRVSPTAGASDHYDLTPAATVGVLTVEDLAVEIAPRLPLENVLFLAGYAIDPRAWRDLDVHVGIDSHLFEAVIPTFARLATRALRRGLLHGYRSIDETATTIRGRIRFPDQLRRRPGRPLPVELTYDEFTPDILENRLLLAATERLARLPLRHASSRRHLLQLRELLTGVTRVGYPPSAVPVPTWTRLNRHYVPAATIARLVLQGGSTTAATGGTAGRSLLLSMPTLFEDFVVAATREALGASPQTLRQGAIKGGLHLDQERGIRLEPDLSWWPDGRCRFVGDCKYKRATDTEIPNADLYQLLAYTTALQLDDGLLIYAAGEHDTGTHTVRHAGKRLHVVALNLAGPPAEVLDQIQQLASSIRSLAAGAHAAP